ncbi:MAG: flagellar protein FliS [Vallitalea sp.]|jgi:flagellar protein FliS|nr:flagellar protein FliS [Vallitalea sp.]
MTESTIKDYQNRIISANKEQLLIITYELFVEQVNKSIEVLNYNNKEEFDKYIVKAQKFHRELMNNLDMSYEISSDLLALYIYMNKKLIQSALTYDVEPLEEVIKVANILLEGFRKASVGENSEVLIKNAQKLYAGLTYGKGTLNETIISDESRGFKA